MKLKYSFTTLLKNWLSAQNTVAWEKVKLTLSLCLTKSHTVKTHSLLK